MENINKERLPTLDELTSDTVFTKDIWEINKRKGVTFEYKSNTWIGHASDTKTISLGKEIVPDEFKRNFNLSKDVPDTEVKKYMFSHENMHHILFDLKDLDNQSEEKKLASSFINMLKQIRDTSGVGISRLGSLDFYKARNTGHEEDMVELLNLYSLNPNKLEVYLNYLIETDNQILKDSGLAKISINTGLMFSNNVKNIITKFIERNKI